MSITLMEAIENATMLVFPGAMDAGPDSITFWGPMALGFAIALPFAFLANRYLLKRGKGHALVRQYQPALTESAGSGRSNTTAAVLLSRWSYSHSPRSQQERTWRENRHHFKFYELRDNLRIAVLSASRYIELAPGLMSIGESANTADP